MQKLRLRVYYESGEGPSVDLPPDRPLTIGRGHTNDLPLGNTLVSLHHARIDPKGGYYVITDLNSRNQTFVNGVAITRPVALQDRDQLLIGGCQLVVQALEAPAVMLSDKPDVRAEQAVIETTRLDLDPATIRSVITDFDRSERNLAVLHAVSKLLAESREPGLFLPKLLDLMFEVVPADRGVVFIVADGAPRPLYARDYQGEPLKRHSISRSVLRRAVDEGACVLKGLDQALDAQESIIIHQIKSAMCAPIRGRNQVLGAIYLDSQLTGKTLTTEHLELLSTVAIHAGLAHENHRLTVESAQAERMAAIGLLVAGLAHDIRNYMLGLTLGQDMVEREIRERCSPGCGVAWDTMKDSQWRIMHLVQDMLAYSKPREPEWQLVDPNQVAARAISAVSRRAGAQSVHLQLLAQPQIGRCWLDPGALERGLVNLAGNALDATGVGGVVTVQVALGADGRSVQFLVSDTGSGIPPSARAHVFDLFFSTKKSKGTGLGLAVTKKMVEEHGGTITFVTELDEGTTFVIAIPLRAQRPEPRISPAGEPLGT